MALALIRQAYEGRLAAPLVGRDMSARRLFLAATLIGLWAHLGGCRAAQNDSTAVERADDGTVTVG